MENLPVEAKEEKEKKLKARRVTGIRNTNGYSWIAYKFEDKVKKAKIKESDVILDFKYFSVSEFEKLENYK